MPTYEVTSPEGKKLRLTGEKPPTEKQLNEIFSQYKVEKKPSAVADVLKGLGAVGGIAEAGAKSPLAFEVQKFTRPLIGKEPFATREEQIQAVEAALKPETLAGKITKTGAEIAPYLMLPGGGVRALAAGGALAGAAESARETGTITPKGATIGAAMGATTGGVSKFLKPLANIMQKSAKGLPRGIRETAGIGEEAYKRIQSSPRKTQLLEQAEQIGDESYIANIADNLKSSIDKLKAKEFTQFSQAKQRLLNEGKEIVSNTSTMIDDIFKQLKDKKLINEVGQPTQIGKKAQGLNEFLEDINAYKGAISIDDLQSFKSSILDDIIKWEAPLGQAKTKATKELQDIAKNLRFNVNEELGSKLGSGYKAINKKVSDVINTLDNPEIKDIINAQKIDTLATKLKKIGTTRQASSKALDKVDNILRKEGLAPTEFKLIDEILDYTAAKDINQRVRTGLGGGISNILKQTAVKPILEETLPVVEKAKTVMQKLKPIAERLPKPPTALIEKITAIGATKHVVNPDGSTNQRNIDKIRKERGIR